MPLSLYIQVKWSEQVQYNIQLMESDEEERPETRTHKEVWQSYIKDKLYWLKHKYMAAGEKGVKAYKQVKEMFAALDKNLRESHYNNNDKFFKTFDKLQQVKYFRHKPYSRKDIITKIEKSLQPTNQESFSQLQFDNLYDNFKSIIKYLTRERYSMTNVAKHIFLEEKEEIQKEEITRSFIFDVQRGKDVKWEKYASELLLYIFLKSVAKGIMELQLKGVIHLDLYLRNILLFGCQDLGDLQDSRKIANNPEIMFKIIDFDFAFLLGSDCLQKTLQLLHHKSQIQGKFQDVDPSLLKKNPKEEMESRHANYFANCFDRILQKAGEKINLSSQEKARLRKMIQGRRYEELMKLMEENINKFKKTN